MTDKETREKELLELITDAENLATVHAKEYGETYHSMHEAWAILLEELKEVKKEYKELKDRVKDFMWDDLIKDNKVLFFEEIPKVKKCAKKGIVELLHVIAVCNKIEGMK